MDLGQSPLLPEVRRQGRHRHGPNWAVEVSNPTDMTRPGWARTSFKVGDEVTVTLQPVKSGAPVGRLRSVILPNGQTLDGRRTRRRRRRRPRP